jgi:hypothetical protein
MTRGQQISKALELLEPPRGDRDEWRKLINDMIRFVENAAWLHKRNRVLFSKTALEQYLDAMRRVHIARTALDPAIDHNFLPMVIIDLEIETAEGFLREFLKQPSPPRNRPVNRTGRAAVMTAKLLLGKRRFELTKERKGRWHMLAQVLANTSSDLRHYMSWRKTDHK